MLPHRGTGKQNGPTLRLQQRCPHFFFHNDDEATAMDRKRIAQDLRRNREWIKRQLQSRRPRTVDGWTAENIMVGCIQFTNCCGHSLREWIDRKAGRRAALERIQSSYQTRRGNRVLIALVDLTVSELEACTWMDEFPVGALPIKAEPKRLSLAQRVALARGRQRAHDRRREERGEYQRALESRLSNG